MQLIFLNLFLDKGEDFFFVLRGVFFEVGLEGDEGGEGKGGKFLEVSRAGSEVQAGQVACVGLEKVFDCEELFGDLVEMAPDGGPV